MSPYRLSKRGCSKIPVDVRRLMSRLFEDRCQLPVRKAEHSGLSLVVCGGESGSQTKDGFSRYWEVVSTPAPQSLLPDRQYVS
jgi:hypothetical protein